MRPIAFRIRDFKSIEDSGVCHLSGDGITVLAGQNEAGKTAILTALRDFDLDIGAAPLTADYEPEERINSNPTVSVLFGDVDGSDLANRAGASNVLPDELKEELSKNPSFWITRELRSGKFLLDERLAALWPPEEVNAVMVDPSAPVDSPIFTPMKPDQFADWLRDLWPGFLYFEAFRDSLPREADFGEIQSALDKASTGTASKVPSAVLDFILMAGLDIERIASLAPNDKLLGNYLSHHAATITGDFLTYWKQKVDKEETVDLKVRQARDVTGKLKLAFYVHDKTDQYPDQRSKGFLWFLSFYLKLAAYQKRYPDRKRVLLIDEPGSYLHARAQKDVLDLLEGLIAKKDQVIYSTHSPFLIPPDRLHRLRIVLKKSDSGTKVLDRLTHPDLRGVEFADSLSPVIAAIGIDITQALVLNKKKNIFVEGISDYFYLTSWAAILQPDLLKQFNIFPATGAATIPLLGSLFIGWGFGFVVLVDNDDMGQTCRRKLINELSVPAERIVSPKDAKTIEDLFSSDNFHALLALVDESLTLEAKERPSTAIHRQGIDKVLLARTYSEHAKKFKLTNKSEESIKSLLLALTEAWGNG